MYVYVYMRMDVYVYMRMEVYLYMRMEVYVYSMIQHVRAYASSSSLLVFLFLDIIQ